MAANKIISFRIDEEFQRKLEPFGLDGESLSETARRLLVGVVDGENKLPPSSVELQLTELWTAVNELKGKYQAAA